MKILRKILGWCFLSVPIGFFLMLFWMTISLMVEGMTWQEVLWDMVPVVVILGSLLIGVWLIDPDGERDEDVDEDICICFHDPKICDACNKEKT